MVKLQTIQHHSGAVSVAELDNGIDFLVERVYFLHGLGAQSVRGAHAHRALEQMVIAASGSFCIDLEGKFGRRTLELNNPSEGLLIPPMVWRDLHSFSEGAVCVVLASQKYEESDYIRDFEEFQSLLAR